MLIRFSVKNLFSFKEETEFNLLPARITRLGHHKYIKNGVEVLKLSALYGANGAGKSNLIKSLNILKTIVQTGRIPRSFGLNKFKLSKNSKEEDTYIGIEFFKDEVPYYYAVKINENLVQEEELYISGLGNKLDKLIFHRKMSEKGVTTLDFFEGFNDNSENVVLKNVIEKDLLNKERLLIHLLSTLSGSVFNQIKSAFEWFIEDLEIIFPDSAPTGLVNRIDIEPSFKSFAIEMMRSFQTGIVNMHVEIKDINELIESKETIDEIALELKKDNKRGHVGMRNSVSNEEIVFVNENEKILSKRLHFEHSGESNEGVRFNFDEESDGTRRLLEYLPAFEGVIKSNKTIIIDEIERSIHPLIVKELIKKFSVDEFSRGQLIFSTHESNLLDQDILRQDEIWFVEKNRIGSTEIYPLSEFKIDGQKEHHTINLQKGYLTGRYGGIPFLGNLSDLNWHQQ